MESLLHITSPLDNKQIKMIVPDNKSLQQIWDDIKQIILKLKANSNKLTYLDLSNKLWDIYYLWLDMDLPNKKYQYYIELIFEPSVIQMIAYNHVNYDKRIECFRERYIINNKNEGNCIDDFIKRGIEPLLDNINDLKESIKSRKEERILSTEYHNTWCYEKDFTQISLIKKQAEKIIENCNKHLERISEFYTKL